MTQEDRRREQESSPAAAPEQAPAASVGPDFDDPAPQPRTRRAAGARPRPSAAARPAAPPGGAPGPEYADSSPPPSDDARGWADATASEPPPAFEDAPPPPVPPVEGQGAEPGDRDERNRSPWPARAVAALTVVAILAILLALLLPRRQAAVDPEAGPAQQQQAAATTQDPAPSVTMQPAAPVTVAPAPTESPITAPALPGPQQHQPADQTGPCPTCGGTGTMPCPYPEEWHDERRHLYHWSAHNLPRGDDFAEELRRQLTGGPCHYCYGDVPCAVCTGSGSVASPGGRP